MTDLLPCPFCGNEAKHRRIVEEYAADADGPAGEYDAWFKIQCDNCGAEQSEEYRSDAIAAWNRRASDASLRAALEEIRDATNADDPESYRCDDREGCLDTVFAIAVAALGTVREPHS